MILTKIAFTATLLAFLLTAILSFPPIAMISPLYMLLVTIAGLIITFIILIWQL